MGCHGDHIAITIAFEPTSVVVVLHWRDKLRRFQTEREQPNIAKLGWMRRRILDGGVVQCFQGGSRVIECSSASSAGRGKYQGYVSFTVCPV